MSVINEPGAAFQGMGYDVLAYLRKSHDRYNVCLLGQGRQRFIGKEIAPTVSNKARKRLRPQQINQVVYYRRINDAVRLNSHVRCPRVLASSALGDYYVAEYFKHPFYPSLGAELINLQSGNPVVFVKHAPTFAEALWQLDSAFLDISSQKADECPRLTDEMQSWRLLEEGIAASKINEYLVQRGAALINRYQAAGHVKPCLQHMDAQPLHWFWLGADQVIGTAIGLIDSERSGYNNPRYYDLASMYARLYTICNAPKAARIMLRKFVGKTVPSSKDLMPFWHALLPVITLRAIGMMTDGYYHSSQGEVFYMESAEDLLERCLTENIERLTAA